MSITYSVRVTWGTTVAGFPSSDSSWVTEGDIVANKRFETASLDEAIEVAGQQSESAYAYVIVNVGDRVNAVRERVEEERRREHEAHIEHMKELVRNGTLTPRSEP